MTNKRALSICIKIWAIIVFVKAIYYMPQIVTQISALYFDMSKSGAGEYVSPPLWRVLAYAMTPIFYFIFAFLFYFKSEWLAEYSSGAPVKIGKIGTPQAESAIFGIILNLIGINCVVEALPGLFKTIGNLTIVYKGYGLKNTEISISNAAHIAGPILLIITGIILFIGYKKLFNSAKTAISYIREK